MSWTITVEGMTCEHCEQTVEEALQSVEGVTAASADRSADAVSIDGDADPAALIAAAQDAGYDART